MRINWTKKMEQQLSELYADHSAKEVAEMMGISIYKVYNKAQWLGLEKSDAFKKSYASGRFHKGINNETTQFKKGHKPWNHNIKGIRHSKATEFKKGNKPHNTKPVGTISVRYSDGKPYKVIKLGDNNWMMLSRFVWEQAHGPIPAKHLVSFFDANPLNCELSNLKLVSMADNALENGKNIDYKSLPKGSKTLSDSYVAGLLAWGNKKLKKELLKNPQLLEAKRQQLILNRTLKQLKQNEKGTV